MAVYSGPGGGAIPEIVQHRSDGLWYSTSRVDDRGAWPSTILWVARAGENYKLRWVSADEPLLSASTSWQTNQPVNRWQMPTITVTNSTTQQGYRPMAYDAMSEDKARVTGYQLAGALCDAWPPSTSSRAGTPYTIGRIIARLSAALAPGDVTDAFTEGFVNGWKQQAPRLAAPVEDSAS